MRINGVLVKLTTRRELIEFYGINLIILIKSQCLSTKHQ